MFTGIIQAVGNIAEVQAIGPLKRLTIAVGELELDDVALGDSIAVNGVCLTVVAKTEQEFTVEVSPETLNCTVGLDQTSRAVNLEKALRLADRLGGHLVTGHVDAVGSVVSVVAIGDCLELTIEAPSALSKYIAAKGSITLNGVSLTVNRVAQNRLEINLIPHTLVMTNLKELKVGSRVNLEVDLIARYVERMLDFSKENDR